MSARYGWLWYLSRALLLGNALISLFGCAREAPAGQVYVAAVSCGVACPWIRGIGAESRVFVDAGAARAQALAYVQQLAAYEGDTDRAQEQVAAEQFLGQWWSPGFHSEDNFVDLIDVPTINVAIILDTDEVQP